MIVGKSVNFIQPSFTANVMPVNCAKHIDDKLKSAKTVDIFCHTSSDEDTFNSAKAMYSYLESNGVKPRIIVSGGKECYEYDEKKYNLLQSNKVSNKTQKADLALCLDFSSKVRVLPNVKNYLDKYGENVVGFDHHNDKDKLTKNYNHITSSYKSIQDMPPLEAKNYYIDSSAQSNCAIISRFFDAIGHTPKQNESKALFCGMFDDNAKSGLVKYNPLKGFTFSNKLEDNGNTKEIMRNTFKKLNILDKISVFKHFVDNSQLSEKEVTFQKGLNDRVQTCADGKFAYVEIKQGDKEWEELGRDTEKTKSVLGKFRNQLLKENKNLKAVAVFYPTNLENTYKMSINSTKDYAKRIIENIKNTTCPELVAGGHDDRSGGTINSSDADECSKWVELFKNSAKKVL